MTRKRRHYPKSELSLCRESYYARGSLTRHNERPAANAPVSFVKLACAFCSACQHQTKTCVANRTESVFVSFQHVSRNNSRRSHNLRRNRDFLWNRFAKLERTARNAMFCHLLSVQRSHVLTSRCHCHLPSEAVACSLPLSTALLQKYKTM